MAITEARMSHLVRWDAKKGASFVHALRLDVDRDTAERAGRAYGIIVADAPSRTGEALAAHLEDAFTRGMMEAVRRLPADAPQDQLFEAAIARTNHAVSRLFGELGLGIEAESVSAAIVAVRDHDLVAATWGAPSMLLFHPLPNGTARVFDMAEGADEEPQPYRTANARRCFGSIVAGRMGKRDRLLLASHDLRSFLGDEALVASVMDHEPDEATAILNHLLSPRDESLAVALMIVDVAEIRYLESDPTVAARREKSAKSSAASIAKLLQTQHEVGETLSPSIISGLSKKVSGLLRREEPAEPAARSARVQRPAQAAPTEAAAEFSSVPELPASLRQQHDEAGWEPTDAPYPADAHEQEPDALSNDRTVIGTAFAVAMQIVGGAFRLALRLLRETFGLIASLFNAERRADKFAAIAAGADRAATSAVDRYNGIGRFGKAMLLVAILFAYGAKGAMYMGAKKQAEENRIADHERTVASIEQKIDSAAASAIYRDEYRANALLDEAEAAIAALAPLRPEDDVLKASMLAEIATTRGTLRREIPVEPVILASVATSSGDAALARISYAGDALWAASANGEVFRVPTAGGVPEKVGDVPNGGQPSMLVAQGKNVFAASADGSGALLTPAGKSAAVAADFKAGETVARDAESYNGRLYVLDTGHNRITRHLASVGAFGAPEHYLKDGTDLSGSVSLAIDGIVWVLKADGSILRIAKGLRESFDAAPADPPVTAAVRLRTAANADLFVLDASPARILRIDKSSGSMVGQYVSPALAGATDFAIDEKGATAYVVKGNQVLSFPMPKP